MDTGRTPEEGRHSEGAGSDLTEAPSPSADVTHDVGGRGTEAWGALGHAPKAYLMFRGRGLSSL